MIDALFKYKMWDFTSGTLIYVNTHISKTKVARGQFLEVLQTGLVRKMNGNPLKQHSVGDL